METPATFEEYTYASFHFISSFVSVGWVTMKIFSYKGTSAHTFCITDFISLCCHTNICKSSGLFCPGLAFPVEGRKICKLIIVVGAAEVLCLAKSDRGKKLEWHGALASGWREKSQEEVEYGVSYYR